MTSKTTPAPQVWPTLTARDAPGLIAFLVDAFGFQEALVIREGDRVDHAELAWPPGGGIMLGSDRGGSAPDDPWIRAAGSFGGYAVTDDPDGLYTRAVAAGAKVVREPNDTGYGSRDFVVSDPEGNLWSFGTYRGAPR
ncbi:VOC family protein [Micromonospora sp. LOL_023]|uniref:VOC family protein n=1 Tax=Micromonospora sp. LOL_023 TaxID=3345418 RepID=UPI003A839668